MQFISYIKQLKQISSIFNLIQIGCTIRLWELGLCFRKGLRPIFRSKIICPEREATDIIYPATTSNLINNHHTNNINSRSNNTNNCSSHLNSNSLMPSNGMMNGRLTPSGFNRCSVGTIQTRSRWSETN